MSHCPVMCDSQAGFGCLCVSLNWLVSQRTSFSEELKSIFGKILWWFHGCGRSNVMGGVSKDYFDNLPSPNATSKKQREHSWCYPFSHIRWFWGRNRIKHLQLPKFAFHFQAPGEDIYRKMATAGSPSPPCTNWKLQYRSELTYSTLFSMACL